MKDWNPKTTKAVAVCLSDYDDKKSLFVDQYDSKGQKSKVDAKRDPIEYYYVVRENERYIFKPKTSNDLIQRCAGITCDCPFMGGEFIVLPIIASLKAAAAAAVAIQVF